MPRFSRLADSIKRCEYRRGKRLGRAGRDKLGFGTPHLSGSLAGFVVADVVPRMEETRKMIFDIEKKPWC